MDLERYYHTDGLAKLELENLYNSSSEKEKIEITKEFNKRYANNTMPRLWAEMTIKQGSLQEKIILARHYEYLEDDLLDMLQKENSVLVKCALYENRNFLPYGDVQKGIFLKATQLEKLAIVRNPHVDDDLILQIYDINDKELGLSDKERMEIVFAFCTNKEHIENSKKEFFDDSFLDGMDAYSRTHLYPKIYEKAFDWHTRCPDITCSTFKNFSCPEDKKLEIYKKIKDDDNLSYLRVALFESIPERHFLDSKNADDLYREGLTDKQKIGWIRMISAARINTISKEEVKKLLEGKDKHILEGLLCNQTLTAENMKLIIDYIDKEDPELIMPDMPAINLKRRFRERYHQKLERKKEGDMFYFLRKDEPEPDLEEIEDFPKETYKILFSLNKYTTKYIDKALYEIFIKTKWVYWIVLAILLILVFIKR